MNIEWVKIRSWHALSGLVSFAAGEQVGYVGTRCGRWVTADDTHPTADTVPGGEKSCESCLRLIAREVDLPPVDNDDAGA